MFIISNLRPTHKGWHSVYFNPGPCPSASDSNNRACSGAYHRQTAERTQKAPVFLISGQTQAAATSPLGAINAALCQSCSGGHALELSKQTTEICQSLSPGELLPGLPQLTGREFHLWLCNLSGCTRGFYSYYLQNIIAKYFFSNPIITDSGSGTFFFLLTHGSNTPQSIK